MPKGPAARVRDPLTHPLPPVLTGSGSPNVTIGGMPAWRGMPAAGVPALQQAKQQSDMLVEAAENAARAAMGTPGAAVARAQAEAVKTAQGAAMTAAINAAAGPADRHSCSTPLPIPQHGIGVVIDGSASVRINGLQACRMNDTILEALGPPNKIAQGCPTVHIGD